jgi:hypothetical protein
MNSLAVFGNSILNGTSPTYLNFGSTAGFNGYGIRDNSGTMEFKNSGGSWTGLTATAVNVLGIGAVSQIKFADGTTQTTAPNAGGITAITTASCNMGGGSPCTVTCPSTYYRTGCSGNPSVNIQSISPASNGCTCSYGGLGSTCYAFCAK